VRGLAEVAHARGVPLVVDEAWGAHLAFSDALPEHALAAGADLVVSSTHKHAGSLSQSAMLHLGTGGRFDESAIADALLLVSSTSPSSLLLASLDAARRHAALHGARSLERQVADLAAVRARIRAIDGLDVLDARAVGSYGIAGIDPLRICVDVRGTGFSGHEVARVMRRHDDVHVELCGARVLVAVFGLGEDVAANGAPLVRSLARACASLRARVRPVCAGRPERAFAWGAAALSPREAFLAPREAVPFAAAEGRIAAECLAAYPPGIPNAIPGERLSSGCLAELRRTLDDGGVVRGAADPTLATLLVVAEPALSVAA
jgi:lysine decarboxylase